MIANYLKDIGKIQFKTVSNWVNLLALLSLSSLVEKNLPI
jgi:alpha-D-ribose 1-methylphosphonate 5-triphosphate synthase subunit PhnL